eukprot:3573042-Pyramimonas_sp.AAC.1
MESAAASTYRSTTSFEPSYASRVASVNQYARRGQDGGHPVLLAASSAGARSGPTRSGGAAPVRRRSTAAATSTLASSKLRIMPARRARGMCLDKSASPKHDQRPDKA